MHTHDPNDPVDVPEPQPGYEPTDVSVPGILVFLAALGVSVVVFFVLCFGMGKVINNALVKHDGPPNKWTNLEYGGNKLSATNMVSNPALEQQQLRQMTQSFPTPRLETDDGNQDLADLHERENLLLEHYSWIDRGQGKVRIPISRAMELIAQKGLPVVSGAQIVANELSNETESGAMVPENGLPKVQVPLTNGFAPTAYEQELASSRRAPGEMGVGGRNQ